MVITVCYGQENEWKTREEAEQYFLDLMMQVAPGKERDRYVNVYIKLKGGRQYCTDNMEE